MDLNDPKPNASAVGRVLYDCARGVAFVSAVAIAVILVRFLIAWLHVKNVPPTDTKAMSRLIELAILEALIHFSRYLVCPKSTGTET